MKGYDTTLQAGDVNNMLVADDAVEALLAPDGPIISQCMVLVGGVAASERQPVMAG